MKQKNYLDSQPPQSTYENHVGTYDSYDDVLLLH